MTNRKRLGVVVASMVFATACFHQIVQTGLPAGSTVVEKPWVSTWLWGLVPAAPIDVRAQCPSGVATVETSESFANGLLGLITVGIWAPQTAKITCASGMASVPAGALHIAVQPGSSAADQTAALGLAVRESIARHATVVVTF